MKERFDPAVRFDGFEWNPDKKLWSKITEEVQFLEVEGLRIGHYKCHHQVDESYHFELATDTFKSDNAFYLRERRAFDAVLNQSKMIFIGPQAENSFREVDCDMYHDLSFRGPGYRAVYGKSGYISSLITNTDFGSGLCFSFNDNTISTLSDSDIVSPDLISVMSSEKPVIFNELLFDVSKTDETMNVIVRKPINRNTEQPQLNVTVPDKVDFQRIQTALMGNNQDWLHIPNQVQILSYANLPKEE